MFRLPFFLAFGYVQDIAEMRVHTRDKTGFVVFERLLVEDYELFPPEYRKAANRRSQELADVAPKPMAKSVY